MSDQAIDPSAITPEQFAQLVAGATDEQIEETIHATGTEATLQRIFEGMKERFKPESAARLLRELLESRAVAAACAHVRDRMRHENGIEQSCDWIEALARLPRLKCAPVTPAPPPESFPSPTPAQSACPSSPPPALR